MRRWLPPMWASGSERTCAGLSCLPPAGRIACRKARIEAPPEVRTQDSAKSGNLPANGGLRRGSSDHQSTDSEPASYEGLQIERIRTSLGGTHWDIYLRTLVLELTGDPEGPISWAELSARTLSGGAGWCTLRLLLLAHC